MGLSKEAASQLLVSTVYENGDATGWTLPRKAFLTSREFGSADDAFELALRLGSGSAGAWTGGSEALGMEGRFGEGAAVAAQGAALLPNSSPVLAQLGRALTSGGEGMRRSRS